MCPVPRAESLLFQNSLEFGKQHLGTERLFQKTRTPLTAQTLDHSITRIAAHHDDGRDQTAGSDLSESLDWITLWERVVEQHRPDV